MEANFRPAAQSREQREEKSQPLLKIGHYALGDTLGVGTFGKVKGKKCLCKTTTTPTQTRLQNFASCQIHFNFPRTRFTFRFRTRFRFAKISKYINNNAKKLVSYTN